MNGLDREIEKYFSNLRCSDNDKQVISGAFKEAYGHEIVYNDNVKAGVVDDSNEVN